MGNRPLSDELARQAADAYRAASFIKADAARALKLPNRTFDNRLERAAERGMLLDMNPAMPGFAIKSVASKLDGAWVKQTKAPGETFDTPDGHAVKGVSALLDPDGRVIQKWVKTREDGISLEAKIDMIKAAFLDFQPAAPFILRPNDCDSERLTAYVFCDWHLGLYAYGKETGGPDWDLSIARNVLRETVGEMVDQSPRSKYAIVLGLGDLLHMDNSRNMTERSGNVLDVDTRYSKVLETACDLLSESTEWIATKHERVEAVFKPGNHDPESTVGIRQALRMYFRNTSAIEVDTSPNPFYWKRFGVNLIGGTHGHETKLADLPMIMANIRKRDWADTITKHFHTGHVHHDTLKEVGGVHVFSHRAPVVQDAYHAFHGYLSGRSMRSFTYHAEKGARGTTEIEIR